MNPPRLTLLILALLLLPISVAVMCWNDIAKITGRSNELRKVCGFYWHGYIVDIAYRNSSNNTENDKMEKK